MSSGLSQLGSVRSDDDFLEDLNLDPLIADDAQESLRTDVIQGNEEFPTEPYYLARPGVPEAAAKVDGIGCEDPLSVVLKIRESIGADSVSSRYSFVGPGLNNYVNAFNGVKLLSRSQEFALAHAFTSGGEDVRRLVEDTFIVANQRWIFRMALETASITGVSVADCINSGNLGIIKSVSNFDPSFDCSFLTYANHQIRTQVKRFVAKNHRGYDVAFEYAEFIGPVSHVRNQCSLLGRDATDEFIVDYILKDRVQKRIRREKRCRSCSDEQVDAFINDKANEKYVSDLKAKVKRFLDHVPPNVLSLDEPVSSSRSSNNGSKTSLGEFISAEDDISGGGSCYSSISDFESQFSNDVFVRFALEKMPDRLHRTILYLLYLHPDPEGNKYTLQEIGKMFLLTRERVRQLSNFGIKWLRKNMSKNEEGDSMSRELDGVEPHRKVSTEMLQEGTSMSRDLEEIECRRESSSETIFGVEKFITSVTESWNFNRDFPIILEELKSLKVESKKMKFGEVHSYRDSYGRAVDSRALDDFVLFRGIASMLFDSRWRYDALTVMTISGCEAEEISHVVLAISEEIKRRGNVDSS